MTNADAMHERLKALMRHVDAEKLEEACDEINEMEDGLQFVPDLIAILENNPEFDFGSPGSVTHTAEKYFGKGYEVCLLESVRRSPTDHTVWMLSRLVNGASGNDKAAYTDLLKQISISTDVRPEARSAAEFYLE